MSLVLKGARLIDPQVNIDGIFDVEIKGEKIASIAKNLEVENAEVVDLSGKILIPGLCDVHTHLREPGFEHKETIYTGSCAAAKGGYTTICAMPNTNPCIHDAVGVEFVKAAAKSAKCQVIPSGACTKDQAGEQLADIGDMYAHGVRVFTDDGHGIQKAGIARLVMDYSTQFDCTIMVHAQDNSLAGAGQVNEGVVSTRLGLLGWPAEAEEIAIARDIALARLTGAKLHIQHITTARGLELVKAAKAEGLPITCEATPHHMFLTESDIDDTYPTSLKVNPPLRTKQDAAALIAGLCDGSVDMVSTDHAPHAQHEKAQEFELAPFGMTGLESALAAVLTNLVATKKMDYARLVQVMSVKPRELLRLEPVKLEAGSEACLTAFDPNETWVCGEGGYASRASNCGFDGMKFTGRATDVFVCGKQTLRNGVICE